MFAGAGVTPPRIPVESGSVIANREILRKSDFLTLLSPDQVTVELEAGWLTRICEAPGNLGTHYRIDDAQRLAADSHAIELPAGAAGIR